MNNFVPFLFQPDFQAMNWQVRLPMNEKLFVRDPEQSELGQNIVRRGALLMDKVGFDAFTFKKLAAELNTAEASVYRYFENKHRLLTYLVAWYWSWLEYRVVFGTNNLADPAAQLKVVVRLIGGGETPADASGDMDLRALHRVVIREAAKAYHTSHVTEDNKAQLFKPYKDLCARIADIIKAHNPKYPFTRSLASTLLETAHDQTYFMTNLPSLTDFPKSSTQEPVVAFLEHLLFNAIGTHTAAKRECAAPRKRAA
ncbi:MAG TPA: TetR/AcrR family transcriptional regulator, partial [Chitinophagales bacterium]|nr:TetR/AcrR family transcriptional regulator [Chitinophagales bacterium]